MFRLTCAVIAFVSLSFSQDLPALLWVRQIDALGTDTFAGLGTDSQGNTYVAGSTLSANFPVKAAVQSHLASAGLYRIDGPGSAYTALGLTSASSVAVDPQNPNTLFATSQGAALKSTDDGVTFSPLMVPSSQVAGFTIDPTNDKVIYAATYDLGAFKSIDGGATWTAINNGLGMVDGVIEVLNIWIDPGTPSVLFAAALGGFARSADAGASWKVVLTDANVYALSFDTANPGTLYGGSANSAPVKSTDDGETFVSLTTPGYFGSIVADPNHAGRLIGAGQSGVYESDDGGATWTRKSTATAPSTVEPFVPDWANGVFYGVIAPATVARFSNDLQTVTPVGPPALGLIEGITVANGHAYVAVYGSHDVFVTKFDASGNIVFSTYFGGSAEDRATAVAADAAGNVYVAGTTSSLDFPVTKGSYASSGGSFLFRLNPDGSIGYSTYFAVSQTPSAIAVDAAGSAYLAGSTSGGLPTTPGAYQTDCSCSPIANFFLTIFPTSTFLTKFDPTASALMYSTYLGRGADFQSTAVLALAPDGSAYVATPGGVYHVNAAGSSAFSPPQPTVTAAAIAVGPDGSVYLAGPPGSDQFQTTAGTFESSFSGPPSLPAQVNPVPGAAIVRMDAQLANVLAATYFGGPYGSQVKTITTDSAGNLYIGGSAAPRGLPARTPLQEGFAPSTGFLSELSGDLSTLLFSSYLGDTEFFGVLGLAIGSGGSVVIGGATQTPSPANVYVNSLAVAPPPSLRIDAVENAASLLDGPISAGETIVVRGAGFGGDTQLSIGDAAVPAISITATAITAVVPQGVPTGSVQVQVQSGGAGSNQVLVPVSSTSPGIFSADGSGYGQGYILNQDGTLNTPSNPASPGDRITIFATGVGPVSFTQGYAVTEFPVTVLVDGFYADGVSAVMGPVNGFPASVFQITVTVPNPASLVANNPNLSNFAFPPLVGVIMQIDGAGSQNGLAISIGPGNH